MTEAAGDGKAALFRKNASILSPLRYPGGKRRLVGYIAEALRLNGLRPKIFVEPFAGGANVALQLLSDGIVESIALGEKDALIAGFWRTVFFDHEWLIEQVRRAELAVEEWERFRRSRPRSDRGRALKCLYLNRTSFSGILSRTAGPIGGRGQQSEYTLGCRFPVETLVRRIRQAAALADRVRFVRQGDWRDTIQAAQSLGAEAGEVFYYLDPPFFAKAERLYRFCFRDRDHLRLRDTLAGLPSPFLLSYDAAEAVARLYANQGVEFEHVEMLYSTTRPGDLVRAREVIVTNLAVLPSTTRLWMTSREWKGNGAGPERDAAPVPGDRC